MNPSDKLLQDANKLGIEASKQTGVAFKPIQGTPIPTTTTTSSNIQPLVNNPINVDKLQTGGSTYNPPKTSVPNQTGVGVNALANKEPIVTTTDTTPDKAQTLMDKLLATDVATQKADLRAKADLQAKNQEYNTALADYKNRKTAYEDQIEEIRKNPEGKMRGALEYEVQELQRKANKDLANMAVGVELMQNNYVGAEKILNDQIADIQTSYDNDVKKFQLEMDFLRNDMTESEKLKANQAFDLKKSQFDADLAEKAAEKKAIRDRASGSGAGSTAPKVTSINGVDSIWDGTKFVPATVSGSSGNETKLAQSQGNIKQVENLLKNPALGNSVGTSFLSRFLGRGYDTLTGDRQNFISDVEQVASQLTIDNLVRAKAGGATFGALSDGERELLAKSGTKLNTWAIKDKNGKVTGYNTGEKAFKQEMDKINNFAKLDYINKGGLPENVSVKVMPDGSYVTLNSDGTYTKLK